MFTESALANLLLVQVHYCVKGPWQGPLYLEGSARWRDNLYGESVVNCKTISRQIDHNLFDFVRFEQTSKIAATNIHFYDAAILVVHDAFAKVNILTLED